MGVARGEGGELSDVGGGRKARRRPARVWPDEKLATIRANIFPAAHGAIADWPTFSWRDDTDRAHSSQALAIDVFGAIRAHPEREAVLRTIARNLGLPEAGPWDVVPEWYDEKNALDELTPTQVDAAAIGAGAIILFEGKFTETGGSCSQPKRSKDRAPECAGAYVMQSNPRTGVAARCALSGKGIRYWDHVAGLYGLDPAADHSPCPFRHASYQWMRNSVLAKALAKDRDKAVKVVAAYADADYFLPTANKARRGDVFGQAMLDPADAIVPMSYQAIVDLAERAAPSPVWGELRAWVLRKIEMRRPG